MKIPMSNLCECGCGEETKYNKQKKCYNDYLHGHNGRGGNNGSFKKGWTPSEEIRQKMSDTKTGIFRSEATKRKISESLKGGIRTEISKQKMSDAKKGGHLSEEHKCNISKSLKGKIHNGSFKKGYPPPISSGISIHSICDVGYEVRSSYERKFSDGMYALNIKHTYEPELFHFKGGISYRPDYLISELNLYIELKGYMRLKDKIKHELFRRAGYKLLILDKKFFQRDKLFERVLKKLKKGGIVND